MLTPQKIDRTRRSYNKWVANQTLEDYALRFTANEARRWSSFRVTNTAFGAISFLALEAIGGAITLNYGFTNAVLAIFIVGFILLITGFPIAYYAAKYGVDIDLLTRGAGFGYLGSTITSLIYASFTFILFAIEAAIMSLAIDMCFGIPLPIGYLISALVVIPLVTHGITLISRFQLWTQPIWIILNILPFIFIAAKDVFSVTDWTLYTGKYGAADGSFDILLLGSASAVIFALMAQIGEQVDYLRFLPRQQKGHMVRWWAALIAGGPGWILPGVVKMLLGSFLAVFVLSLGVPFENAAEPSQMYLAAFSEMVSSPGVALGLTGIFVIVSQLKINVTNAYAGSIAWSNFFSRLTHSHPGRVVWVVFNVSISLILMEIGIFEALEHTLGLFANISVAWLGTIIADLVINKPLKLSPPHIEFKRAHLYDINPVGVGSMLIASTLSLIAHSGFFGELAKALAPFIALNTALIAAPILAFITKGKYYIARAPDTATAVRQPTRCCICEHTFEAEDMAYCPIYSGPICSLCCSLDARCNDGCKSNARFSDQLLQLASSILPPVILARINTRLGQYIGLMLLVCGAAGIVLGLIYLQATLDAGLPSYAVSQTVWAVFFVIVIAAGVTCWLFILAHESRRAAQEESQRQTNLLMREIRAHKRTDAALQEAKENAEAASNAKSRYMAGISHELRTPLNSILGYAQILENDPKFPSHRRHALRVIRRSGEHLADLIEGLLDISKIEAGRLDLIYEEFNFAEFLEEIVDMFQLQAQSKGITFNFERPDVLPEVVRSDKKRVRQILINLLSNALNYTEKGHVTFVVKYRLQVAKFSVSDSGIGIKKEDVDRIFLPFEQIRAANSSSQHGTGLGLTITKLLVEILGGELLVDSEFGKGTTFQASVMLSPVRQPMPVQKPKQVKGYKGKRISVVAVDDDPNHRDLLHEVLEPIGFHVVSAENSTDGLEAAKKCNPDIFLLDISLPDISGWELAETLRQSCHDQTPIIMISALGGGKQDGDLESRHHDALLAKPIKIPELLDQIGKMLKLQWQYDSSSVMPEVDHEMLSKAGAGFAMDDLRELREKGRIGHIHGILNLLDDIEEQTPELAPPVAALRLAADNLDLDLFDSLLDSLEGKQHDITE